MMNTTNEVNTDYEVRSLDSPGSDNEGGSKLKYLLTGVLFGILLVKSEVISWFRMQEMFRFQEFHMYGVIGSAIATGMISVWLLKRFKAKTVDGKPIVIATKKIHKGNIFGGLLFGFGWALTGACPGPLFAQIGTGAIVVIVPLLSALAGTWIYGRIRQRLPH
jgi:uncharacterized membrane protein YedE/YeeE